MEKYKFTIITRLYEPLTKNYQTIKEIIQDKILPDIYIPERLIGWRESYVGYSRRKHVVKPRPYKYFIYNVSIRRIGVERYGYRVYLIKFSLKLEENEKDKLMKELIAKCNIDSVIVKQKGN